MLSMLLCFLYPMTIQTFFFLRCPLYRTFITLSPELYHKEKGFIIIFISSNIAFDDYYKTMSWLALDCKEQKQGKPVLQTLTGSRNGSVEKRRRISFSMIRVFSGLIRPTPDSSYDDTDAR